MTKPDPYSGYCDADMLLRDHLALERTRLANERTLLAYLRSGVALILAGATFLYFAGSSWLEVVGLVCIPMGVLALFFGLWRYLRIDRRLRQIGRLQP